MGRAKLSLKLKDNKKARRVAFEKRRKALEKKAFELSTLCGVKIGMILYGPSECDGPVEPIVWPENHEEIEHLISSYKNGSDKQCFRQRTYDLSNFYKDELKKVKEELAKTREKNIETKYPTWDEEYDKLTSQELKSISSLIQDKIDIVKSRIDLTKATMNGNQHCQSGLHYQQPLMPSFDDHESFDIGDQDLMKMNNGASSSGGDENSVSQDFGFGFLDNVLLPNGELMNKGASSSGGNDNSVGFGFLDNVLLPNDELTMMMMNNGASSSGGNENSVSQDFGFGFLDNVLLPNDELMMMCNDLPNMCVMPEDFDYPFYGLQDQVCLY